jgi:plastocyanin
MTRARRHLAATAVVAAALLAACGSSGSDDSSGSTTPAAASVTAAAGGGASTTAAGGGATTAAGAPAAGASAVSIKGFAFNPGDVSVKAGTKVTWTNDDSTTHKIKSDDGSFDSEGLSQGDTFEHTFDAAGTFPYICSIHPSMKGTITVTA